MYSHFLMYSGSITKSEDEVSDVDIGDGGCRGVHVIISSSMSIGVGAGSQGRNPASTTGSHGLAVSFLCIRVTAISAIPIKA